MPTATATTENGVVAGETVTLTVALDDGGQAVNVGRYPITATISDNNYTLDNAEQTFEITQAEATATWYADYDSESKKVLDSSLTYDGAEHKVTLVLSVGSYSVAITSADLVYRNAKSYQFTATDESGNFKDSEYKFSLTVNKAELTIATAEVKDKTYNAQTDDAIIAFTFEGYKGSDAGKVEVAGYDAEYTNANAGESVEVTISSVTLTGQEAVNYTVAELPYKAFGKVNKAEAEVEISGENTTYTGSPQYATVTVTGVSGKLNINVTYTLDGKEVTEPIDAGVYDIKISIIYGATNYKEIGSYTLTIAQATITSVSWYRDNTNNELTINPVYDGSAHKVIAIGNWNNGGKPATETLTVSGGSSGSYKDVTADGYTFTATANANFTFKSGIATTFTVNVQKKSVTVSGLYAQKVYDGTTAIEKGGIKVDKAVFATGDIYAGDEVKIASAEGTFVTCDVDNDSDTGKTLNIASVTLSGAQAGNYVVNTFVETMGTSAITPATIKVSGTLDLSKLDVALQEELAEYLKYNGKIKTIAITNSPLSKVPKVDANGDLQSGEHLSDGVGGVGMGGTHAYFYLPLTSANAYGLTIEGFYGGYTGTDIGDGAIITFMFATSLSTAGEYSKGGSLYLEANIANTDTLLEHSTDDDIARLRANYTNTNTSFSSQNGIWNYADFTQTTAKISISKLEVSLKWRYTGAAVREIEGFTDEQKFNGGNYFGGYGATFVSGTGVERNISDYATLSLENGGKDITEAGEYTIVVTPDLSKLLNHTIKSGTDRFTVKITPYQISEDELSASISNAWINSGNGNRNLLADGTFSVDGREVTANNAFAWIRDTGAAQVTLNKTFFSLNGTVAFVDKDYSGNVQQENVYSYTATAVLVLNKNFGWLQDAEGNPDYAASEMNHESFTFDEDGNLVITKAWYLVRLENGVDADNDIKVNGEGLVEETGFDWIFGDSVTITEPKLMNKAAGENSAYTLTLLRLPDGTSPAIAVTIESIKYGTDELAKYLNAATPAGFYSLTLHVASCTVDGRAYPKTDIPYIIGVGNAAIGQITVKEYSGEYDGKLKLPEKFSEITGSINPASIRNSVANGVWRDSKYDVLYAYGEENILFSSPETENYVSKALFGGVAGAPVNVKLKEVASDGNYKYEEDSYTVQFSFKAPNYGEYRGIFHVTVKQKELTFGFTTSKTDKITIHDNNISWIYDPSVSSSDLFFQIKGGIESDIIDIRYAYYNTATDPDCLNPLGHGAIGTGSPMSVSAAGSYAWRFTFNHWNSEENQNNNYKISNFTASITEELNGKNYIKPCYVVNLTIAQKEIDLSAFTGFGDDRTAVYTGREQHYFASAAESNVFYGEHKSGDDFRTVKILPDGAYGYHTAYITIKDPNLGWPASLADRVDANGRLEVHLQILPAELTVEWTFDNGAVPKNYTYDGNPHTVTATMTWSGGSVNKTVQVQNVGKYTVQAELPDTNFVFENGATVSVGLEIAAFTVTEEMIKDAITVTETKVYDGTASAMIAVRPLRLFNQTVELSVATSYASKNVNAAGVSNPITVTVEFASVQTNYVLGISSYKLGNAKITPYRLDVNALGITSAGMVYNGQRNALGTLSHVSGVLQGVPVNGGYEQVGYTVTEALFDSANVGSRTVTLTVELHSENYYLAETNGSSAAVTKITISGQITPAQVVVEYNGETQFTYSGENFLQTVMSGISSTPAQPVINYTVLFNGIPVDNITANGHYVITAQLAEEYKTNYAIVGATDGVFTVTEITVTGNIVMSIQWSGMSTVTYTGTDFAKLTAVAVLSNGERVELQVTGKTGSNIGVYTFDIVKPSDYIFGSGLNTSYTVTVTPAQVSAGNAIKRVVYSGEAYSAPAISLTWSGGALREGTDYTVSGPANAVNVGTYVYTVKLLNNNFTFTRGSTTTATLYIQAATVSVGEVAHVVYDGNAHVPELRLSWSGGDLSESDYTLSGEEAVGVGKYTYTVMLNSQNFTFTTGRDTRIEFIIDKKSVEKPAADSATYVYDGTEKTYAIAESSNYTVLNATRTNAGSQTVRVVLSDKRNTEWADGSSVDLRFTFTIQKAIPQVSVDEAEAVVYDGESHPVTVHVFDATLPVRVTYNGYTIEPVNAGLYAVVVSVPETENYKGVTVDGITVVITKKPITVNWGDSTSFEQDGAPHTPYNGMNGDYDNLVRVIYTKDGKDIQGTPVAAGEYTVKVELVNSRNYELSGETEKAFTITAPSAPPVDPDNPDNPDKPDQPDQPDKPDQPDQPDKPDTPDEPIQTADGFNWDILWYILIALSVVTLIFATISTAIYVKKYKG